MPTDLPRPRDREELPVMCRYCGRDVTETHRLQEAAAVPPVSPSVASDAAPAGELPELIAPWQVFNRHTGAMYGSHTTKDAALKWVASTKNPNLVVGKIAYSEVIEPEAPDSWERLAKDLLSAAFFPKHGPDNHKSFKVRARLLEAPDAR